MNLEKFFKVAVLVLFAVAILVYGMVNRYQFFHINGNLAGFACNNYTGKCEWLSPEEMGKEKLIKYQDKERAEMGRPIVPPGMPVPAPAKPR